MRKIIYIVTIFIISCDDKMPSNNEGEGTSDNVSVVEYSNECKNYFFNMIAEIGAVSSNDSIISLYEFIPEKEVIKKGKYSLNNSGVYLYLLILDKITKEERNMSLYYNVGTDEFFPIYFHENEIEIDLETMIILPFKNIEFNCGSIMFSDTLSDERAGIWSIKDSIVN
jgi:hypothetical protein